MSKKPGSVEAMTESVTATEELTHSTSELLGPSLPSRSKHKFLLRLRDGIVSDKLAEQLRVEAYAGTELIREKNSPVVLGPFFQEELQTLVSESLLSPWDLMLKAGDRWRTVKFYFPEFSKTGGAPEELTATAAVTDSGFTAEQDLAPAESLELEDSGPFDKDDPITQVRALGTKPEPSTQSLPAEKRPELPRSESAGKAPRVDAAIRSDAAVKVTEPNRSWMLWPLLVVVGVGAWLLWKPQSESPRTQSQSNVSEPELTPLRAVPERLQSLTREQLWAEGLPQMQRLRFLNLEFQQGRLDFTPVQLRQIRSAADPASSSWELRRFGSNLLGAILIAQGQVSEAQNILKKLYEAAPSDPSTILNLAIAELSLKQNQSALELVTLGSKLCPPSGVWVCQIVQSYVEWQAGSRDLSTRVLQSLSKDSLSHAWALGLRLALLWGDSASSAEIQRTARDLLQYPFDTFDLSPIGLPVALPYLRAQMRRAQIAWAESDWADLTPGQRAFLKDPSSASDLLNAEKNSLSQLLVADLHFRMGRYDQATQKIQSLLPSLEAERASSSWPWTLAGDVALENKDWSSALLNYEKALSRQSTDARALLGQGLALRAQGEYLPAQQKLEEALILDPELLTARLRMSRAQWYTLRR